jgi:dTDP-4-dehydrorhamnose reductase
VKILIIGKNGQLARALAERCAERGITPVFMGSDSIPASGDSVATQKLVSAVNDGIPDVIINASAYTNVEKAETEGAHDNYLLNFRLPLELSLICRTYGIPLIHISTDFVFDGTKQGAYTEDDMPNPLNAYGDTKLKGESAVMYSAGRSVIIRTSWLFNRGASNFVSAILKRLKSGNPVRVVGDETGGPTYAGDLAETCLTVAERIATDENFCDWGIYNYSGTPYVSRYEMAEFIRKAATDAGIAGISHVIEKISAAEYPSKVKRPRNSTLDNTRISEIFGVKSSDWQKELRNGIRSYLPD